MKPKHMTEKETKFNGVPNACQQKLGEETTNQQQQEVATKLIIENKEFEIIPYRVNKNTEWYIPELGLMIRKSQK
ncbi:MAG: hypothetical protein MRERV_51c007 [Mycoplasmataceae bacterium RV_VA103A]|nr:MAG: hypothetical protein MRERV_51c007 [Mycoplasmataceae bacterium RV_VA103A]